MGESLKHCLVCGSPLEVVLNQDKDREINRVEFSCTKCDWSYEVQDTEENEETSEVIGQTIYMWR